MSTNGENNEETSSPPIKRRRSSLMKRKSIGPVVVPFTREVAVREYICETKEEKLEWVDLYRQRKSQQKIAEDALDQALSDPPTLTFENLQRDLTEEDLNNIKRPDYQKLACDIDIFLERTAMMKTNVKRLNSLIDLNHSLAKSRLNAISKNICSYNEMAPLWKQDPSKFRSPNI